VVTAHSPSRSLTGHYRSRATRKRVTERGEGDNAIYTTKDVAPGVAGVKRHFCFQRIRQGCARLDAGEIDVLELDDLIHHYKRSAPSCGSSADRAAQAASARHERLSFWSRRVKSCRTAGRPVSRGGASERLAV
jgi:hypothetical protein